jgi:cell division protein FtsW
MALEKGKTWFHFDAHMLMAVAGLLAVGLVAVNSAQYRVPSWFFKQLAYVVIGLVVMVGMARIDYHWWHRRSLTVLILALVMLVIPLVLGERTFGSTLAIFGGSVQPSEFAKLAIVIYVADWLRSRGTQIRQLNYGLIPFSMVLGVVFGLIMLQPDVGTALVVMLAAGTMFFVAGAELGQVVLAVLVGGLTSALFVSQMQHVRPRIDMFLNVLQNPLATVPDQPWYCLAALRSGRWLGAGLGKGVYKLLLEPAQSDLIMGVIGEELGLLGTLTVVGLMAWFIYRGYRIAFHAPDSMGMLMAAGVTTWIGLQAAIHIGVITASMPSTGLPLPFVSYGGSCMVMSLAGVGLLSSVWRASMKEGTLDARGSLGWWNRGARLSSPVSD